MSKRRLTAQLVTLVSAGAAAAVLAGAAAPRPAVTAIDIRDFAYRPAALTVARGAAVRWVNRDEETHTVTSASGAFASSGLEHDEVFEQRFSAPGTYRYFCALHPRMTATIVVR